jgi:hypothetical protein
MEQAALVLPDQETLIWNPTMRLDLGASNRVLLLLCLMYLILYVDRVNISTAAPLIRARMHPDRPFEAAVVIARSP